MNEFLPMIQESLLTVGGALIALLAAMAVRAISNYTVKVKAEATKIKNEGLFSLADDAIALASDLATTTVTSIEQTTAATLRKAVKDGLGTPAQMKQLAYDAAEELQAKLHPQYIAALEEVYGDVNAYLLNLIEQKVWELKNLSAPSEV